MKGFLRDLGLYRNEILTFLFFAILGLLIFCSPSSPLAVTILCGIFLFGLITLGFLYFS